MAHRNDETSGVGRERTLVGGCALLALLSVAPLLAWVFRLGRMSTWGLAVGAPAVITLAVIAFRVSRSTRHERLRSALAVGAFGGLVGTLGYDVFRLPFAAFGLRLLSPIDSYGVLLLDAHSSSVLTGFVGWSYHFTNGVCFGIAYARVAYGRRWYWGVAWALVLETATVVTPFADTYGLRGRVDLIAIAYAADVAYGAPLGLFVARGDATVAQLREVSRRTVVYALAAVVAALLVWQQPFTTASGRPGPHIVAGHLQPQWLRVAPGGCALVHNDDAVAYTIAVADHAPTLPAHRATRVCFSKPGAHRVQTSARPWSGGFVIVDPEDT